VSSERADSRLPRLAGLTGRLTSEADRPAGRLLLVCTQTRELPPPRMASRASSAAASGASAAAASAPTVALSYPFVQRVSGDFSLGRLRDEYTGIIRVRRQLFAAERCPVIAVEAFRDALRALKSAQPASSFSLTSSNSIATSAIQQLGPNPQLYQEVVMRARELLLTPSNQPEQQYFLSAGMAGKVASDPLFSADAAYHQQLTKNFAEIQNYLENQLLIQKRDGEREQIKVASLNLAEFYLNRGDLASSLNKYLESKEFVNQSSTPQTNMELLNIALNIIKNSILLMNMSHVKTQVQRAQRLWKEIATAPQSASAPQDGTSTEKEGRIINAKLNAAMGLFHLKGQRERATTRSRWFDLVRPLLTRCLCFFRRCLPLRRPELRLRGLLHPRCLHRRADRSRRGHVRSDLRARVLLKEGAERVPGRAGVQEAAGSDHPDDVESDPPTILPVQLRKGVRAARRDSIGPPAGCFLERARQSTHQDDQGEGVRAVFQVGRDTQRRTNERDASTIAEC
jgi:hypothetical protein